MHVRGWRQTMPPTGGTSFSTERAFDFSQLLRQQLTDLGVPQSICGSMTQASQAQAAAVIPQLQRHFTLAYVRSASS